MGNCLTGARFNMEASVLHQEVDNPATIIDESGSWVNRQDPDSGEIIRVWLPATPDDPDTPLVDETTFETFPCIARGIIDGGIRVAGTTERFDEMYEGVDFVRIQFPASVKLSRRDRVTNIRGSNGEIIWREYDQPDAPPTVFNVNGATPIIDPFGNHMEYMVLLERAEIQ